MVRALQTQLYTDVMDTREHLTFYIHCRKSEFLQETAARGLIF